MPIIDRREIIFDEESLIDILASLHFTETLNLPEMAPSAIDFDSRDQLVTVHYNLFKGTRSVPLKVEVLGALLVSYCVRARFPIPRKSAKSILITKEAVVVSFQLTFGESTRTRRARQRVAVI